MKRFTSTSPTTLSRDLVVGELRRAPIELVYILNLPPRAASLHGPSVEFFFRNGELAISGEVEQVGPKQEAFHLAFRGTLGQEYWKNEMREPKEKNVGEVVELSEEWRAQGLDALLSGPRDVRLYARSGPQSTGGKPDAVEIIAKGAPGQRILFIASQDDPGDVIVIGPSSEYEEAIAGLMVFE